MSDVFNEVDEELRRDKANELFVRYRPYIIVTVAAIVLGVSGYKSWEWYAAQKQAQLAESYESALALFNNNDFEGADKALSAFAMQAPGGYEGIALLERGAAKSLAGKPAEAAALFTQAAEKFSDPLYKDLSVLRASMVVADDLTLADLDSKLKLLTGPGRAFRFTALELLAGKAMQEGERARARDDFTYISLALDAPAGARARAGQALAVLGPAPEAQSIDLVAPVEAEAASEITNQSEATTQSEGRGRQ